MGNFVRYIANDMVLLQLLKECDRLHPQCRFTIGVPFIQNHQMVMWRNYLLDRSLNTLPQDHDLPWFKANIKGPKGRAPRTDLLNNLFVFFKNRAREWWFDLIYTGGLEHEFYFPFHIWDNPIDELYHFSRWLKPPTSIYICIYIYIYQFMSLRGTIGGCSST